jgi:hypothetical protein
MAFVAALPAVIGIVDAAFDLISITTTAFEISGAVDASGAIVAAAISDATATAGGGVLTQGVARQVAQHAFTEASEAAVKKGLKKSAEAILKTAGSNVTKASMKKGLKKSIQKLFLRFGLGSFAQILEFVLSVTVFILMLIFRKQIKKATGWGAEKIRSWFHKEKTKKHKEIMKSHAQLIIDVLRLTDMSSSSKSSKKKKK